MKRSPLAAQAHWWLHFVVVATGVGLNVGCGARSELRFWGDDGATSGGGGNGGDGSTCAALGESCSVYTDCCDAACTNRICAVPVSACLGDEQPVLLAAGFADPYAMGNDVTSLFVGQLASNQPIVRVPKMGDSSEVLVESINFVDFLTVKSGLVFFSEEKAVSSVSLKGGPKTLLASAVEPTGIDVTSGYVYFADRASGQLVQVNRSTLTIKALGNENLLGIYRVAAAENVGSGAFKGLIYFSDSTSGLHRHRLYDGGFDSIDIDIPPARAVRIFADKVYYTVASTVTVRRVGVASVDTKLVADLSSLGVYLEALESDGTFLYLTLETGTGNGLIVRVPMEGGEVEIVADAQGPRPSALVVDDHCVYWTERETGSVFRARKDPAP